VSDIALAGESAAFALPEVRLGIVPAVISPFVLARVGLTRARQLMLTGARIGAAEARELGIVHEACLDDELDEFVDAAVRDVLRCAPQALRACKRLLFTLSGTPADTLASRVDLLNQLRAGEEAQQGIRAFLTKQPAPWVTQS
jgi:methylglutaconyl-CoA hydratase